MTPNQAFKAFREANPFPVVPLARAEDAREALAVAKGDSPVGTGRPPFVGGRRGILVAAAAFLGVLAIGSLAWLVGQRSRDVVDDPVPPPIETTTTIPATATTLLAPTPELQAELDRFIVAYNSGDFEVLESILEPGLRRTAQWDFNPIDSQTMDRVADLYEIESELNTTLALSDCEMLGESRARCTILREDDLTRSLGLSPQNDGRLTLEFSGGLIASWDEQRPPSSDYNEFAVFPFTSWVRENHPEIPDPNPCNGCPQWQTNIGLAELIADLVDEWSDSLE